MKKRKVLICGGRDFADFELLQQVMLHVRPWLEDDFCIINGFARGADKLAHIWAFMEGVPSICVPANWNYYGKNAGQIRNEWMLEYCNPDLVIAFPGGSGTSNMKMLARCRMIDVYEVINGSL